ncbi:MAG TPA: hypothetical protein VF985_05895, partial [Mariniflexile sp.]
WEVNDPLLIQGKVERREDTTSLIVESIQTEVQLGQNGDRLFIRIPENTAPDKLKNLKNILVQNPGDSRVSLIFEGSEHKQINLKLRINWKSEVSNAIQSILNPD